MNKFNIIKLFIYENKRKIIVVISLILVFLVGMFLLFNKDTFKKETVVYENLFKDDELLIEEKDRKENENNETIYYFVDIKGFVNNPGVYSVEKGKRVVDVINKAGGVKKDANTKLLNLSMEIYDEMVIVVYSNEEVNNIEVTKEQEEKQEVICKQEIVNDACICNEKNDDKKEEIKEEKEEVPKTEDNNDNLASEKININKASIKELMTLSKIGESKAKAIIEYRESNGLFQKIEDIKNVSGIGDALFETIKEYITV